MFCVILRGAIMQSVILISVILLRNIQVSVLCIDLICLVSFFTAEFNSFSVYFVSFCEVLFCWESFCIVLFCFSIILPSFWQVSFNRMSWRQHNNDGEIKTRDQLHKPFFVWHNKLKRLSFKTFLAKSNVCTGRRSTWKAPDLIGIWDLKKVFKYKRSSLLCFSINDNQKLLTAFGAMSFLPNIFPEWHLSNSQC